MLHRLEDLLPVLLLFHVDEVEHDDAAQIAEPEGFLTSSAAAQTTQAGSIAADGDLGVFFPDEAFEKTFTIDGFGG
jgi:hypothetical protein